MDEDMVYLQQQEIAELEQQLAECQAWSDAGYRALETQTKALAGCQAREEKLREASRNRLKAQGITVYSGEPIPDDTALKEAIKQAKREAVNHILEMWHEPWPRTERRFIDRLEAYAEELK